jgi:hypothetical protein
LACEQEIDGLPGGIHGSVQVSVLPFDPDVALIDAIALIDPFQVRAAAPVQFRPEIWTQRQIQLEWMSRPRSSAISAICANEIGNVRYHRTHQRMISPGY